MKVVKAKSAKTQDVRTRARAREVEKTKIWSTQNGSRKYDSFFSKHLIKTSDVFQKTLDFFPKTWEVFQHISHVFFYTLRCTIPFTREISHRTTTYSTAGTWLCPVIPISQHTKGSAKEECGVKTDGATTVHPETTKLGRLQSEKRWR